MKYEMMFPEQIREAIKKGTPVILPVGVIEYHSEHCVVGVDSLLVLKTLETIEKEMDIIILPAFYYGVAGYVVEPPENNGTINVSAETVYKFMKEIFRNLLRIGFRNIYVFIHHQTENFIAGMPTDLACKLAGRESVFEFIEKELGEGWWGKETSKDYYNQHEKGKDPLNWIKVFPLMNEEIQKKFPIDHAGKQETSLMLSFCPEGVDMKKFTKDRWYSEKAEESSLKYGEDAKKMIIEWLKRTLKNGK